MLELLGTDTRVATQLLDGVNAETLARVVALLSAGQLDRVVALLSAGQLDRVVALLSAGQLARVVALLSAGQLARVVALLSAGQLDRVRKVQNAPAIDKPYSQILAALEAGGKLEMGAVHTCKTTHCLAGWTVTIAGKAGKELEKEIGWEPAAALILRRSRPDAPLPNFYADNEPAMAFIRARAKEEI